MIPLPTIRPLTLDAASSYVYIGCVGFEARSHAILEKLAEARIRIRRGVGVTYVPQDARNSVPDFVRRVQRVCSDDEPLLIQYRRFEPETFSASFAEALNAIAPGDVVILDTSGMSKFLIAVLLHELRSLTNELVIAYGEAETYHPTLPAFEARRAAGPPEATVDFLTTEVNRIVTTTGLSSVAMQGYPLLVVAFPTFNHRELLALVSELSPQKLVLLRGRPHDQANAWRMEAVDWINRGVKEYISGEELEEYTVTTFDYTETVRLLDQIYHAHFDTHRIVMAPTGSKLQTVAVWLLKIAHPDVQLVYPVTTTHVTELTDGVCALWEIRFTSFSETVARLDAHRVKAVRDLEVKLRHIE